MSLRYDTRSQGISPSPKPHLSLYSSLPPHHLSFLPIPIVALPGPHFAIPEIFIFMPPLFCVFGLSIRFSVCCPSIPICVPCPSYCSLCHVNLYVLLLRATILRDAISPLLGTNIHHVIAWHCCKDFRGQRSKIK